MSGYNSPKNYNPAFNIHKSKDNLGLLDKGTFNIVRSDEYREGPNVLGGLCSFSLIILKLIGQFRIIDSWSRVIMENKNSYSSTTRILSFSTQ